MPSEQFHTSEVYFGRYRGRVVEVDVEEDGEPNRYGAIRVFLPDFFLSDIDEEVDEFKDGILAYPANNNLGGYNEDDPEQSSFFAANVYVPKKNSYVVIEFENGDITKPYYTGPWLSKMSPLPPENRNVDEPHKVYTVIKSGEGRAIIVSDSPDVARVEITGRKRLLNADDGPQGNNDSVYTIDGNQSVILISEEQGNEKILIKTYKGDYINLDVEKRSLNMDFDGNININSNSKISIKAKEGIEIASDKAIAINSQTNISIRSEMMLYMTSLLNTNIRAIGNILMDGISVVSQTCLSCISRGANPDSPEGDRGGGEQVGGDQGTGE